MPLAFSKVAAGVNAGELASALGVSLIDVSESNWQRAVKGRFSVGRLKTPVVIRRAAGRGVYVGYDNTPESVEEEQANALALQAAAGGVSSGLPQAEGESVQATKETVCTADVMECWDGSYVQRIAPECGFAPCPPKHMELPTTTAGEDKEVSVSNGQVNGTPAPIVEEQQQQTKQADVTTNGAAAELDVSQIFKGETEIAGQSFPNWLLIAGVGFGFLLLTSR